MFDDQPIESLQVGFFAQEPNLELIEDFLFGGSGTSKSTFALRHGKK
jgi:hypothetical protein